jgi:hypothetical protein
MPKKVINNPKKEENKMCNSKTISNVLLTLIALILGVIAFNTSEANKEQKLAMKGLSTLVGKHYGHVVAVNLTNEGRRVASAIHFSRQTLSQEDEDNGSDKYLLNHGMSGINAYLALSGGRDIAQGAEHFSNFSEAYAFQVRAAREFSKALAIKTYSPEVEKIVPQLEAAGISGESMEFGKALAIKTYYPEIGKALSLTKEGKQKTGALNEIK